MISLKYLLLSLLAGKVLGSRLNLVSCAGLAPLVALAARAGLAGLATCHVRASGDQGANPGLRCRRWRRGELHAVHTKRWGTGAAAAIGHEVLDFI
jgi:hypothetical protein